MNSFMKEFENLKISLDEIKSVTKDFSNEPIGYDGFGKVYEGELSHSKGQSRVAIKRLELDSQSGQENPEFWREIMTLTRCSHENLIPLLGFCDEDGEKIIVTELASNGSLDRYLSSPDLTWEQRIKICLGAAQGLSYLHDDKGMHQRVIHRDVKSSNILLNDQWKAKVPYMGLAKLVPANQARTALFTNVVGNPGYVDPSYLETGVLTKESDVYSFGVVLFEVLCGRPCFSNGFSVSTWKQSYKNKKVHEILFQDLTQPMDMTCLDIFSEISFRCVQKSCEERPTMSHVVERLEMALKFQKRPTVSREERPTMSFMKEFEHLRISLEEIKGVTQSFSTILLIGSSGFGKVYRGELSHSKGRSRVAIRRLDQRNKRGQWNPEFWREIMMLTRYSHENLIPLLGFCDEDGEKIIVTELASNGSLDRYLSSPDLTWEQRIKICLGAAQGLSYLHDDKGMHQRVIHRDLKSSNILLDDEWKAKVSYMGVAKLGPANQAQTTLFTNVVGTPGYVDPVYLETGGLTKESDVYSFGVVLFEVLCGRPCFNQDIGNLVSTWKQSYINKKVHEILFQHLTQPMDMTCLDIFSEISFRCVQKSREERPTMSHVVERLEMALKFQKRPTMSREKRPTMSFMKEFEHLRISLEEIKGVTNSFSNKPIGSGGFGKVYEGEISHYKGRSRVAIKRLRPGSMSGQGNPEFWREIMMLTRYSHENLISLLGFCDEDGEKVIVYELVTNGSLDRYLSSPDLMWEQRIKICVDAAKGLRYLHDHKDTQQRVIHRDVKSSNILLDDKWKAKVSDMGLAKLGPANQKHTALFTHVVGTLGYLDPIYLEEGVLTKESDVYSFGVVLFEVLCGRLCIFKNGNGNLVRTWKQSYIDEKIHEIIFKDPKQPMDMDSLKTFSEIAFRCVQNSREKRPTMSDVVERLEMALQFQERLDLNLPEEYVNILKAVATPLR